MSPLLQQEVKLENMRYRSRPREGSPCCLWMCVCFRFSSVLLSAARTPNKRRRACFSGDKRALNTFWLPARTVWSGKRHMRTVTRARACEEVQSKSLTSDLNGALFRSDTRCLLTVKKLILLLISKNVHAERTVLGGGITQQVTLKTEAVGIITVVTGCTNQHISLYVCILCYVLLWSAPTKFSMIADHYAALPSSWLTQRMRRKPLLWFWWACVQETRYPSSGFTALEECNTCGWITSQLVSKYLWTAWSGGILSFWLFLNLNLCRRAVGKTESLLIPAFLESLFHDIFACQLRAQVAPAWPSMNAYLCYVWLD